MPLESMGLPDCAVWILWDDVVVKRLSEGKEKEGRSRSCGSGRRRGLRGALEHEPWRRPDHDENRQQDWEHDKTDDSTVVESSTRAGILGLQSTGWIELRVLLGNFSLSIDLKQTTDRERADRSTCFKTGLCLQSDTAEGKSCKPAGETQRAGCSSS